MDRFAGSAVDRDAAQSTSRFHVVQTPTGYRLPATGYRL